LKLCWLEGKQSAPPSDSLLNKKENKQRSSSLGLIRDPVRLPVSINVSIALLSTLLLVVMMSA
jgi:hypothetical protein